LRQALLEDRSKLRNHRENRDVQVYDLTQAKRGPKLKTASEPCIEPIPRCIPGSPTPASPDAWRQVGFAALQFEITRIKYSEEFLTGL
jgi:uncharacterized protein (TIGR03435 family)